MRVNLSRPARAQAIRLTLRFHRSVGRHRVKTLSEQGLRRQSVQQYNASPPETVGELQLSEESASSGESVDVQEKPNESPEQPATLESSAQLLETNLMQQYREFPLESTVGVLHSSDGSL
jgi:hypothetical protein